MIQRKVAKVLSILGMKSQIIAGREMSRQASKFTIPQEEDPTFNLVDISNLISIQFLRLILIWQYINTQEFERP